MQRKQQLIFAAMILAGIGFFVAAGVIGRTDPPDAALRIPGVEGFTPERGDEVLQQQRIELDLEPGYIVRSFAISPDARCSAPIEVRDFVEIVDGLNIHRYQPDEGKPVSQLAPDTNCVKVIFEDLQRPGEQLDVEWTFTVN